MPLTDVKIRQSKASDKPRKITDGNGLYIEVKPNGSKLWRYRYKIAGKENLFAIGEYPTVSLQDARQKRDEARVLVKQGIHPSHARQGTLSEQEKENASTFETVARDWLDRKQKTWSAHSHKQATHCIEQNAFPKIGRLPIRSITARHILDILQAMEKRGAESYALQLRQWCSAIFRHAVVTLCADFDPAAALKGAIHRPQVNHSKAMTAETIGDLKAKLTKYGGNRTTVLAVRLMIYTFVRTTELRKAVWTEFSGEEWKIPEERMKMRRTHVVPLSQQAACLVEELRRITGAGDWLFPNFRRPNDVMSATTINRALEHMGYASGLWTGHDFRATASTQLHEMGYRTEVIELQLAHVEGNKTKGAYNHAEYITERRGMMQDWADYIDGIPERDSGSTLKLPVHSELIGEP
ncbi:tyrosine-type recombinase/integrase [Propionivibrio sp.]|uniref:tyrosine-type recombinase/integrase n=1 Tax=Propionivibrio sp. TaxID=2212460 RepID=UPI003BF05F0B